MLTILWTVSWHKRRKRNTWDVNSFSNSSLSFHTYRLIVRNLFLLLNWGILRWYGWSALGKTHWIMPIIGAGEISWYRPAIDQAFRHICVWIRVSSLCQASFISVCYTFQNKLSIRNTGLSISSGCFCLLGQRHVCGSLSSIYPKIHISAVWSKHARQTGIW